MSIAEVACQYQWRTAVLGFAAVSGDARHTRQVIDQVAAFIEGNTEALVVKVRVEMY